MLVHESGIITAQSLRAQTYKERTEAESDTSPYFEVMIKAMKKMR